MKTADGHMDYHNLTVWSAFTPSFPAFEHLFFYPRDRQTLEHRGVASVVRFVRFTWAILFSIPVSTVLAVARHAFHPRPPWSLGHSIAIPAARALAWAATYGVPATPSDQSEREVPSLVRHVLQGAGKDHVDAVPLMIPHAPKAALRGMIDGSDVGVDPVPIPAFWFNPTTEKVPAVEDEKVFLFFVGGGYHLGSAVRTPLPWRMARSTGLRILGVNFRKATRPDRAFPAALQDAVAGWMFLRNQGFKAENIILLGDSAGGGLALCLAMYLAALNISNQPETMDLDLGRPRKLLIHSPWIDLTLTGDSMTRNLDTDFMSLNMCSWARDNYLRHVMRIPGRKNAFVEDRGPLGINAINNRRDLGDEHGDLVKVANELVDSVPVLGPFHPFFSPGIDTSYTRQALRLLEGTTHMLVTAGTGELFYDNISTFVRNMRTADPKASITFYEGKDQYHEFAFLRPQDSITAEVDQLVKTLVAA